MIDFATLRRNMVNGQIRTNDVTELALIGALSEVPRERFVPSSRRALAYVDDDLPLGERGQRYLIQPMVMARMIQAAGVGPTDLVLDVGCATGYSAAVVARLAESVVGLEEDPALAAEATRVLEDLAIGNVAVVTGPLAAGWRAEAPYDVILMQGAVEEVPEALTAQLKDGGRLIAVVGTGRSGRATLFRNVNGDISSREIFDAAVPLLPGFSRVRGFQF